jgi:hypothetical protein
MIAVFLQYCKGKCDLVSPTAREELNIKKLGKALSQRTQEEIMQISMIRENMMKLCGMSNNEETQERPDLPSLIARARAA